MHPWAWLNQPQHSAAVQALTSTIYTIAAIVAGWYAAGAYRAAKLQAGYARLQAESAAEQLKVQKDQFTAEAEARTQHAVEAREQAWLRSEGSRKQEDVTRPRFVFHACWPQYRGTELEMRNIGQMTASRFTARGLWNNMLYESNGYVPHDGKFRFIGSSEDLQRGLEVSFETSVGSHWTVLYTFTPEAGLTERVVTVDRGYVPPE